MKPKAKFVQTPVGPFNFPMNPGFNQTLEKCQTDEDLFKLVENNGFINPDAFTELNARGLYHKYKEWKKTLVLLLLFVVSGMAQANPYYVFTSEMKCDKPHYPYEKADCVFIINEETCQLSILTDGDSLVLNIDRIDYMLSDKGKQRNAIYFTDNGRIEIITGTFTQDGYLAVLWWIDGVQYIFK